MQANWHQLYNSENYPVKQSITLLYGFVITNVRVCLSIVLYDISRAHVHFSMSYIRLGVHIFLVALSISTCRIVDFTSLQYVIHHLLALRGINFSMLNFQHAITQSTMHYYKMTVRMHHA